MFRSVEGDSVTLVQNGVFKVCDLCERKGMVFARVSGGYVRLYANGTTSKDKLYVDTIWSAEDFYRDKLGRLSLRPGPDLKPAQLRFQP